MSSTSTPTPDVRLREVRIADLPALYAMQAEPGWTEQAAIPRRDLAAWLDHRAKISQDPDVVWLAAETDGELVGDVVSFRVEGRRMIGYGVMRRFWGRGIASAALRALLSHIEERPLHATVSVANPASMRILEKAGFEKRGAPRQDGDVLEQHYVLG